MGIYGDWAEKYAQLGLSPIPVKGKRAFIEGWNTFSQSQIDDDDLEMLIEKFGDDNIGIVLGQSTEIVCIDLDYDLPPYDPQKSKLTKEQYDILKQVFTAERDKVIAKAQEIIPFTPCIKIGKPGKFCYFFENDGSIDTATIDRYGIRFIDILYNGRQTVIPPSIHPDTKKPYTWVNGSLLQHIENLPTIGQDVVMALRKEFEAPLSDILGKEGQVDVISGRNDKLKKTAYGMFMRGVFDLNVVASHLLKIDEEENAAPLFKDKKEFPRLTPEKAALKFAKSNYKSFKENMKKKPTKSNLLIDKETGETFERVGFYYKYITVNKDGSQKITYKPQYRLMADELFERKNLAFDDYGNLQFNGKHWKNLSKIAVDNLIISENSEYWQPQHLTDFKKALQAKCFTESFNFLETDGLINCNNGILDVKTGELLKHSYQYLFKCSLPIDFDKNAVAPLWLRYLNDVFEYDKELIDLAQKIFGYIILGGEPFLHRAFCLVGEGRNGKSTFLDILRALMKGSYSTVSMGKLDREFSIVMMDGMLANIVEETPNDTINAEVFKTMVGGGEVQASRKGLDEFTMKVKAKFLFSCNQMPKFQDKSVGLEDRLVFIPFNRYFRPEERDTEITNKLKKELSGILNWAIEGAKEVIKTKSIPLPAKCIETKEAYRIEANSVYEWYRDEISLNAESDGLTTKYLFERYRVHCDESGRKPYAKNAFSKALKKFIMEDMHRVGTFSDEMMKRVDDCRVKEDGFWVRGYPYISRK